jgi:hypothetical protein
MSPFLHDLRVDAGDFLDDVLELEAGAQLLFLLEQALHARVVQHAFGVAQRTHDEPRVEFGRLHERVLHVLVHGRFLGRDEARAHVDAFGAQRQCGDQAAAVGHAARGDEGDLQLSARAAAG